MLKRTRQHRHADFGAASVLSLLDLLLVGAFLILGMDGIWTADWMDYPGPVDSTGASYQGDVVSFLTWACAISVLLAAVLRGWASMLVQLVLLGGGALFLASLPTYWSS
ncbi:hypothetical protein [Streptomyces chiangmaiensis]|uniref:Uncharacterized protein n=1 Tax=Streptomyces chiangmaiensis TaxID=766497 RepID=A0ABU7FLR1_9ACTN|nr:hypothetical protein [Streptomyces chiangmaiensis]MED7824328.1 hypothetical protein [Streptomyces chiangmaiensis]